MKAKDWILVALVIIALLGTGYFGYTLKKCPADSTQCDTIYVYDTLWKEIIDTFPFYIVSRDTIIYHDTIFKDVDTNAILKDYYADHYYTRYWSDTLINVTQHDVLSENKFKNSEFSYRLLKPPVIIQNVTNNYSYERYVTIGGSVSLKDIKGINIELMYVTKKFYGKIGYDAYLNSAVIGGGMTILRLR